MQQGRAGGERDEDQRAELHGIVGPHPGQHETHEHRADEDRKPVFADDRRPLGGRLPGLDRGDGLHAYCRMQGRVIGTWHDVNIPRHPGESIA